MNDVADPLASVMLMPEEQPTLRIPIKGESFSIGRVAGNDLCLAGDQTVSRHHCAIHAIRNSLALEDYNSSNGTYLNGKKISGKVALPVPSLLVVGRSRLAVIPLSGGEEELTTLMTTTYSSQGSILVPSTSSLKIRETAFLVVDIVGSTQLLQQDDIQFAKIVSTLGMILEKELRKEPEPFLQCTGDGFFASFQRADTAIEVANQLWRKLLNQFSLPPQLSMALHWGNSYLTGEGSRTGKDVYAAFALERVRHEDDVIKEEFQSRRISQLVLMSEAFWSELPSDYQVKAKPLKYCKLKGLEQETCVFRYRTE